MDIFTVSVKNSKTGDTYTCDFSAVDRDHAILMAGMELGDVNAIYDTDMRVEKIEKKS